MTDSDSIGQTLSSLERYLVYNHIVDEVHISYNYNNKIKNKQ